MRPSGPMCGAGGGGGTPITGAISLPATLTSTHYSQNCIHLKKCMYSIQQLATFLNRSVWKKMFTFQKFAPIYVLIFINAHKLFKIHILRWNYVWDIFFKKVATHLKIKKRSKFWNWRCITFFFSTKVSNAVNQRLRGWNWWSAENKWRLSGTLWTVGNSPSKKAILALTDCSSHIAVHTDRNLGMQARRQHATGAAGYQTAKFYILLHRASHTNRI